MPESEKEGPAGPVGVVAVGDLLVTVTPLTLAEERALRRQLRAAAEAAIGDYFTRCAALLAAMKSQPAAYLKAVERITDRTIDGPTVPDSFLWEFQDSPAGVAIELFARGRKATPGIELAGLKAVVTPANVDDVAEQLRRVLEGTGPKGSAPPHSPG